MGVRIANIKDAKAICDLLGQLGYPNNEEEVKQRIRAYEIDPLSGILVAEARNAVLGFLSFHLIPIIHEDGYVGRITAMVVNERSRREGVGKSLITRFEEIGKGKGCKRLEVTSGEKRDHAHLFYEGMGYSPSSKRFVKNV